MWTSGTEAKIEEQPDANRKLGQRSNAGCLVSCGMRRNESQHPPASNTHSVPYFIYPIPYSIHWALHGSGQHDHDTV